MVSTKNRIKRNPIALMEARRKERKYCSKCDTVKPMDDFHKDKNIFGGRYSSCKVCRVKATKEGYLKRRVSISLKTKKYRKSENGKKARRKEFLNYNKKYPLKYKAHYLLRNAIRDRRITRMPCEKCGNPESEGHHDDYTKPLDVVWLCKEHHDIHHGKTPLVTGIKHGQTFIM